MKSLNIIILLLLIAFTAAKSSAEDVAVTLQGYDYDEVKSRLKQTSLADIEGIWQFMPDGAVIAIERAQVSLNSQISRYNVVIVSSVDDEIDDGTLIGYVYPTASSAQFTAELYSDVQGSQTMKLKKYTLELTDKGHLNFKSGNSKVRLDFWRWLPYLFRISVVRDKKSSNTADGCVKIYPLVPETRSFPINL